MLAARAARPFDSAQYSFEIKWDGIRCLAFVRGDEVRLQSRNLRDITVRHQPLAGMAQALRNAHQVLVDGEIIGFAGGKPSFQAALRTAGPKVFVAFDLLHLDGRDLVDRPLEERQNLLAHVLAPDQQVVTSSGVAEQGRQYFTAAERAGFEGIVAKRLGSLYHPGRRSADWLKVVARKTADLTILGVTAGRVPSSHTTTPHGFGSIVVGRLDAAGVWRYVGNVGTGWSNQTLSALLSLLSAAPEQSFAPGNGPPGRIAKATIWVVPQVVIEVAYREITPDGVLRHPSFVRVRQDLSPLNVTWRTGGDGDDPAAAAKGGAR